ncbi:AAA family ATPase [Agrobacterium rosae]|uniref:ORC1/DEAH AAA+ ATPase domain-containing protein n=1 Tax=Agrobacterium rosae TaxID=1972867 RepID=A0A1R3TGM1_9HYPH|nr:AAA family ATPase [Agrobacterium rosae]SCX03751.1 hypothetical protein DSM25559_0346 [Agrobacterium rosae]
MEMVRSKGEIAGRFTAIMIGHSFADRAFDIIDQMRECRQTSKPGSPQDAGTFFGESNTGKSTTIDMYMETRLVADCVRRGLASSATDRSTILKNQRIVIRINLPSNTSMKSLAIAMLHALGDPNPHRGSTDDQLYRGKLLMTKHGVELLIFDECDHLRVPVPRGSHNRDEATSVHNHLKNLLIAGFPILFVGIPEARGKLFSEKQMERREMYKISPLELVYANDDHRRMYQEFCADLGISLMEKGVMKEISDFISPKIIQCLFEAGGKSVGGTVRIIQRASELAFEKQSPKVEWEHLKYAADEITAFCNYNPFREGVRASNLTSRGGRNG